MRHPCSAYLAAAAFLLLLQVAAAGCPALGPGDPDDRRSDGSANPVPRTRGATDSPVPSTHEAVASDGGVWRPDASVRCEPSLEGPRDVLEGDSLEVRVVCASGLALTGRDFRLHPLPDGAEYDPGSGLLRWTPRIDQAGVYEVPVRVRDLGETASLEIGVVDRWDDPDNVPVDPFTYTKEYGLPVFHLGVSRSIDEDEHTPATLVYMGREYADVQAKYRGRTSLKYPKKSFTLKFDKRDLLDDEPRGLRQKRRIVLTTTFDDSSYLRQRLAYALWNRLDERHIQIAAFNAVLYLDGEYHGLYMAGDHVDDDLMEDNGLSRDGNLYKAREHDANFRLVTSGGSAKRMLHQGYTKEEGQPPHGEPGAYDDLDALVQWIATAPAEEFYGQLDTHIARSEFEDWWIFVSLIHAGDSAGKNSYLYHDPRPDSPQPQWRYVPWDFNASFGQNFRRVRVAATSPPESFQTRNGLFERMLAEPRIRQPLIDRYRAALRDVYHVDGVLELVDAWAAEVEAAALRDEQKWTDAMQEYDWESEDELTTHGEEIEYLRAWIAERWSMVDGLL